MEDALSDESCIIFSFFRLRDTMMNCVAKRFPFLIKTVGVCVLVTSIHQSFVSCSPDAREDEQRASFLM